MQVTSSCVAADARTLQSPQMIPPVTSRICVRMIRVQEWWLFTISQPGARCGDMHGTESVGYLRCRRRRDRVGRCDGHPTEFGDRTLDTANHRAPAHAGGADRILRRQAVAAGGWSSSASCSPINCRCRPEGNRWRYRLSDDCNRATSAVSALTPARKSAQIISKQ